MLSAGLVLLHPPPAAAPLALWAGLALGLGFAALLSLLVRPPEAPAPDWTAELGRRSALVGALSCGLMAILSGGLAWAVWGMQGPGQAIGLAAVTGAFVTLALTLAARALDRD